MFTTAGSVVIFRDIHWKPSAAHTVTVSKQTRKVPDSLSYCSIRYCGLPALEGYYLLLTVPLNFRFHDMSNVTLVSAKSIEYRAVASISSLWVVMFFPYCISIFIALFVPFLSVLTPGIRKWPWNKTDQLCTAQRQIQNRAGLDETVAIVIIW